MNPRVIVIAGASGFVGRALIDRLLLEFPKADIIPLSRSKKDSQHPRLLWKSCDLFSEASIDEALPEKVDLVYYLVHSMEPTAQLDQGSFADHDLIMADNFARACRTKEVKQLIYLGGLIPEGQELSLHLQSRLEVERVFKEHQIPFTFFRAGLILGEKGSSYQMLLKMLNRLRWMICPSWTQTMTSPVDLPTVIEALASGAKKSEHLGRTYDLAGCQPLTYLDMMKITAHHLKLKRFFLAVPFFSPTLSRLWVSLITNTSKYLVYPLIESLEHPMVARSSHSFFPNSPLGTYSELLRGVPMQINLKTLRSPYRMERKTVRSVQRIPVPPMDAIAIADLYFQWLPQWTLGFISKDSSDDRIRLKLFHQITLIEFEKIEPLSGEDRVTYRIKGGLLVKASDSARFEFRLALQRQFVLIAIHDYTPSLPWFIYRYSQALAHLLVMDAFRRHLEVR